MGVFRDPITINNVGAVGSTTNPLTGSALGMDRENQKAIKELIGTLDWESLSILDGGITPVSSEIIVDTEDETPADDLTTINLTSDGTTSLHTGMRIKIKSADPNRVITVKHLTGGGNIRTADGQDVVLSNDWSLDLKLQNGEWVEQKGRGDATAAEVQVQGSASWSADSAPYPINAQVYHNGKQWLALRANSVAPVEGANWAAIGTAATKDVGTASGNVMEVGAFGIGSSSSPLIPEGTDLNTVLEGGNYTLAGAYSNAPMGLDTVAGAMVVTSRLYTAGAGCTQYIYLKEAGNLVIYVRTGDKGSVWTDWAGIHHTGNLLQTTGTSTDFPMSQRAVTDALGQPSMTGSATLNGTTNNTVQLTGIVTTLVLEVGDVIRIQYSGYNKLHTVEHIANNKLIRVNYEHAGNRGNGSLRLPDTTTTVTITRIAKWYNAPIGLGQALIRLDVPTLRQLNVWYKNTTGRTILVTVPGVPNAVKLSYDDGVTSIDVGSVSGASDQAPSDILVANGASFLSVLYGNSYGGWREYR